MHVELSVEYRGVGRVADGDEDAGEREVLRRGIRVGLAAAAHGRAHPQAGDTRLVADHRVDGVVPEQPHLAGTLTLEQAVLHDLLGLQTVATMHQRDARGDVREIERFLDSGVAAADHRDLLAAEEEAVAGRTRGDAAALERFFRLEAEITRRGACGDDQRVAGVLAEIPDQPERAFAEHGGVDVVAHEFGAETQRVRLHPIHQRGAHQAVGIARPVVDLGGGHELAALLHPGDQHRGTVGAGGIDGGRVTGGA